MTVYGLINVHVCYFISIFLFLKIINIFSSNSNWLYNTQKSSELNNEYGFEHFDITLVYSTHKDSMRRSYFDNCKAMKVWGLISAQIAGIRVRIRTVYW